MQVVYDDATQSHLDTIEKKKAEILQTIASRFESSSSIDLLETHKRMHPNYHPLYNSPEYPMYKDLCEMEARICLTAIPRYILTADEYEKFIGKSVNK